MDEYSIRSPASTESGSIEFTAHNVGQIEHEFVVLRTDRDPDDLPVKDAEVQVRALTLVGKTPRIPAGESRVLTANLRPGPYVLICNVPGHYLSGMRAGFRAV